MIGTAGAVHFTANVDMLTYLDLQLAKRNSCYKAYSQRTRHSKLQPSLKCARYSVAPLLSIIVIRTDSHRHW